jgi:hypothetical protein
MKSQYPGKLFRGCLITNTRFTSDALRYAQCVDLEVMSWKHPRKMSLEKLIEDRRLYPVTVISGIQVGLVKSLIDRNIILLKDLAAMNKEEIQKKFSLTDRKAATLKKQADELCLC